MAALDGSSSGPIVVVLPITTQDDQPDQTTLAFGLHEDICGALTRFRNLKVIAPRSASAAADGDDIALRTRFGATHALHARLQSDDGALRLTATLVDCDTLQQVWHERFQVVADDVARLELEVVGRIAATLNTRLEEALLYQSRRRPPKSLAAYELTLCGLRRLRGGTLADDEAARALFERALELDPQFARAHSAIALSWFNEWSCQFWDRYEEASRKAYVHAHEALGLDDSDSMVNLVIAKTMLFRRQHEHAAWYLDRALGLCPNDAELLAQASLLEVYLGRAAAGVAHLDRAMRLNPLHPNYYFSLGTIARWYAGDLEGALAMHRASDAQPFVDTPAFAAALLAEAGLQDEAEIQLQHFFAGYGEKIVPGRAPLPGEASAWLARVNPFRHPEDAERLLRPLMPRNSPARATGAEASAPLKTGLLERTALGWHARFDGLGLDLPDLKGLQDIERLLRQPGCEIHALDLAERAETEYGADAVMDERGRSAVAARIRDLRAQREEAEAMNDLGRAERLATEMDDLTQALGAALGLGGRSRRMSDLAERARSAVTWRIRHAVRKVEVLHPALGRHLAFSIRTGSFCVYRPEQDVRWSFRREP